MSRIHRDLEAGEAQQAFEAKLERARRRALDEALAAVLATPAGRLVVHSLIYDADQAALELGVFTGNSETFYRDGRRSLGLDLKRRLEELVPDQWARLVDEGQKRRLEEVRRRRAAGSHPQDQEEENDG